MRRDLERRLRAVEVAGSGGLVVLFERDDATVRGPYGEQLTREDAAALWRATGKIPIVISKHGANL